MNELMHVMQRQINACNAIMILGLGYVDGHSSYSPWLNHRCKIECLQYPYLRLSMHEREMREKEIEQTHQTSNHFPATTHKTQNPLQPPIHANLLNPTNYHIHHCQPQLRWWEREREKKKRWLNKEFINSIENNGSLGVVRNTWKLNFFGSLLRVLRLMHGLFVGF